MRIKTDGERRWRRLPLGGLLLLVALGALVLAGCGGSSSSSEGSSTTSAAGSSAASAEGGSGGGPGGFEISEEASACLKEQGVELPEFKGGQGGPPEGGELPEGAPEGGEPPTGEKPEGGQAGFGGKKAQEAFKACGVETPQGKPGGAPNTNSAAFRKQVKKYVACVRKNGYELPEPNLSGEGPVFEESEVDQEDPEFKKASEGCQSLLGAVSR